MNIEQLVTDALKLSSHDRARLAEVIWESLEDPYFLQTNLSEAQALVLSRQRDKDIEKAKVTPLSHVELMDRLRNAD